MQAKDIWPHGPAGTAFSSCLLLMVGVTVPPRLTDPSAEVVRRASSPENSLNPNGSAQ